MLTGHYHPSRIARDSRPRPTPDLAGTSGTCEAPNVLEVPCQVGRAPSARYLRCPARRGPNAHGSPEPASSPLGAGEEAEGGGEGMSDNTQYDNTQYDNTQ